MVHFLQQQSGRFEADHSCRSTLAREREAYAAQREFLLRSGVFVPVGASMHAVGCESTAQDGIVKATAEHQSLREEPRGQPYR